MSNPLVPAAFLMQATGATQWGIESAIGTLLGMEHNGASWSQSDARTLSVAVTGMLPLTVDVLPGSHFAPGLPMRRSFFSPGSSIRLVILAPSKEAIA